MIIVNEDLEVKVGGVVLPGIFQDLEIEDQAKIDEIEIEGTSKRAKQIIGYEDARLKLDLLLKNDADSDIETKLKKIQSVFKKPEQKKPIVHSIVSKHTATRGITKVVFKKLTTKESNKTDLLLVSCEFETLNQIHITTTKAKKDKEKTSGSSTTSASMTETYQNYLNNRGSSKAPMSPAFDDEQIIMIE